MQLSQLEAHNPEICDFYAVQKHQQPDFRALKLPMRQSGSLSLMEFLMISNEWC